MVPRQRHLLVPIDASPIYKDRDKEKTTGFPGAVPNVVDPLRVVFR